MRGAGGRAGLGTVELRWRAASQCGPELSGAITHEAASFVKQSRVVGVLWSSCWVRKPFRANFAEQSRVGRTLQRCRGAASRGHTTEARLGLGTLIVHDFVRWASSTLQITL